MPVATATSLGLLFARLGWMIFGPLALLLITFTIGRSDAGWLTPPDFAYFAVLGGMLLARWVEYRSGRGQTAAGEPMTEADLRRYLVGAVLVGLGFWAAANVIGNHWLGR